MLPDIHRATQKFYIFLIVYLTGCTPPIPYICDFSHGGLNVHLYAHIQTLLRGRKYRGQVLFGGCLWLFLVESLFRLLSSSLFFRLDFVKSNGNSQKFAKLTASAIVRTLKDTAFLFVASEQRLDVSVGANIQPATTKVTNRNAVSFRVRLSLFLNSRFLQ